MAAGVFYPLFGILLKPVYAGAAMAFSSVTVVTNANRLRRFKPRKSGEVVELRGIVGLRMMPIDVVLVNVGAVLAIVWIVWYFWMSGEDSAG